MEVIISNYAVRENADGDNFIVLILSGGIEMVQSQKTGRFYATTKKASVPCTFEEEVAKQMIGSKMSGTICKVPCEPFTYMTKSGEEIELDFNYEYRPDALEVADTVLT